MTDAKDKNEDQQSKLTRFGSGKSIGVVEQQKNRRLSVRTTGSITSRVANRRMSYGFSGVPGVSYAGRRASMAGQAPEYRRPMLLFLPTYQLDPFRPFHLQRVTDVIEAELDNYANYRYSPLESPVHALKLSNTIVKTCRVLELDRYRILAVVTIGQRRAQSVSNALSFLWDHERDGYANVVRETPSCYIQVTVIAIYLD